MGMADHDAFAHDLAALLTGRAFVDVSDYRKVRIHGDDAIRWLHDLLTADIAGLTPGASCRSLLLTPTGRIRADVQVLRRDDDVVLTQSPGQPDHIGLLLGPYILSSAVSLEDATGDLALFAVPPAEAALDATIDTTKGCFLGQESVARISNLGHPPRVLRHVRCEAAFVPGAAVFAEGEAVGEVTSAAPIADACVGLVRIAWAAVGTRLTDAAGHPLEDASTPG